MKTKALFMAAALGAAAVGASRVEAAITVVGYVNVVFGQGYTFVANSLQTTNNSLSRLVTSPPDGTRAFIWDLASQAFAPPATFTAGGPGWDREFDLPVGKGFVVAAPSRWTNTFVGEVLQGYLTNFVAGSNRFSLLGSKVPQIGALTSDLAFPGIDGAIAFSFRSSTQRYTDAFSYVPGVGWYDPNGVAGAGGPTNGLAESFFVQNPGPDTNWIRYFIVQLAPSSLRRPGGDGSPRAGSIAVERGRVILNIVNSGAKPYNVQFSTDGLNWKTVATGQTASPWTALLVPGDRGFYQVVEP